MNYLLIDIAIKILIVGLIGIGFYTFIYPNLKTIKNWIKKIRYWYHDEVAWWLHHPVGYIETQLYVRKFPPGTLIEDCRYHPCIITKNVQGDLDTMSLINWQWSSCDLFHCGVVKITGEQAKELVEAYKKDGEKGLMLLRGWTLEAYEEFRKNWRPEQKKVDQ